MTRPVQLSEKTVMPLGMVIMIVGGLIGGVGWLQSSLNRIDTRLIAIELSMKDQISARSLRAWVLELREGNPKLKIPSLVTGP